MFASVHIAAAGERQDYLKGQNLCFLGNEKYVHILFPSLPYSRRNNIFEKVDFSTPLSTLANSAVASPTGPTRSITNIPDSPSYQRLKIEK